MKAIPRRLVVAGIGSTLAVAGALGLAAAPANAAQWYTSANYSANAACLTAMNSQARYGAKTDGCYFKQTAPFVVVSYFRYYK